MSSDHPKALRGCFFHQVMESIGQVEAGAVLTVSPGRKPYAGAIVVTTKGAVGRVIDGDVDNVVIELPDGRKRRVAIDEVQGCAVGIFRFLEDAA